MSLVWWTLLAFLVALFCTPIVRLLAFKIGAVDVPNGRKVHNGIMPRAGGAAIVLGFLSALALAVYFKQSLFHYELLGMVLGGLIIFAVGLLDDIYDISPKVKLAGQIIAAAVTIPFGITVDFISSPFLGDDVIFLGWLAIPVTIFWIIGITNAVNLIDGLDGLASGVATIACLILAVVSWMQGLTVVVYGAVLLAAATVGFLKYNFHPARIFMGDSGAMFLGFTLACLSIIGLAKTATVISVFVPFLIIGIPVFDTGFAILRRYQKGAPIFQADKEHLHHRLLALGFTHPQTVLIIYGINVILGITAILLASLSTAQSVLVLVILAVVILFAANWIGLFGRSRQDSAEDEAAAASSLVSSSSKVSPDGKR